jgi:prophage tail gpP-like protein
MQGLVLKINDRLKIRTIQFFNNVSLELRYDSIASVFKFDCYFDPENHDQEELFCVTHFHEALIEYNGIQFLHGYIISQGFRDSSVKEFAQFGGYTLTGVLEDCSISPDSYPLQYNGLSLLQIATKLISPFKLGIVVDPAVKDLMDKVYSETTAEPTDSVASFLTRLANQRNIIISHDEFGRLLFTRIASGSLPVLNVEEGLVGTEMTMTFSGQQMHSHITVLRQADKNGGNSGQYTIENPFVPIVYRPKTITQNSGDNNSTKQAAQNALAAELKNVVLTIKIDRWVIDGKIIKPNSVISVLNKKLYIYKRTKFFIESVSYEGNSESHTAILTCVPMSCYDGSEPKNIFVDAHQNSPTGFTQNF